MAHGVSSRRAAIELDLVALPGVRALYPHSTLPGAPRVAVTERGGTVRCEIRIAVDRDVPAAELIRTVTDTARAAAGLPELELRIELASID
jgi:hypothetical protein